MNNTLIRVYLSFPDYYFSRLKKIGYIKIPSITKVIEGI
jgi:hypothetical protein